MQHPFLLGGWVGVGMDFVSVCSTERESQKMDLSLHDHSWTGSHLFFLAPECFMLQWINGVILVSKQGGLMLLSTREVALMRSNPCSVQTICSVNRFPPAVVLAWLVPIPWALLVHYICSRSQRAQWLLVFLLLLL